MTTQNECNYNKAHARLGSKTIEAVLRGTFPRDQLALHDGGGLYLRLNPTAPGGFWFARYMIGGRQKKIGLGSLACVSANEARARAHDIRQRKGKGGDPQPELRIEKAEQQIELVAKAEQITRTFDAVAQEWIELQTVNRATMSNYRRWARHARPTFGGMLLGTIAHTDVVDALLQLGWGDRKRAVLFYANVGNYSVGRKYAAINPADKGAVRELLRHHKQPAPDADAVPSSESMPWQQVPECVGKLMAKPTSPTAQATLMVILSGLRAHEAFEARWDEFDLKKREWTVPASRMKMRRKHIVPLSGAMLAVLDRMRPFKRGDSSAVFPGRTKTKPVGGTGLRRLLQNELGYEGRTVRGFRSSLRNWGGEIVKGANRFPGDAMECMLAHKVASGVSGHYYTLTHFAERAKIHAAWADHCLGAVPTRKRGHLTVAA